MWRLVVARSAVRSIQRLPTEDQVRVDAAFEMLLANPFDPAHSRRLQPYRDRRRWRVGDYRIFYTLDREAHVVVIDDVVRRTSTTY